MKKQLIHIHGGSPYDSYEEYLQALSAKVIDSPIEVFSNEVSWHHRFKEFLDADWEVIRPDMPCASNAKYKEWEIWFDKYMLFLEDNVVLVGHSLGATFLAKYLSENDFPVEIGQLHLVAGAYTCEADFDLHEVDIKKIDGVCQSLFIYHSKDDFVVPYEDATMFTKALPRADFISFEDRGHFLQAEFPELIANITK